MVVYFVATSKRDKVNGQIWPMAARKPLKVMLDEEIIETLHRIADEYNRRTGNVVAEEIITEYLEFWVATEKVKQQEKDRQRAFLLGENAQKRRAG